MSKPHKRRNIKRSSGAVSPKTLAVTTLAVLGIVGLLVLLSSAAYKNPPKPTPTHFPAPVLTVATLAEDVNKERVQAGEAALVEDPKLEASAAAKCADMEAKNYYAHNTPSGEEPWKFIIGADESFLTAGENLAAGYDSSQGVVAAWMASPGHRANILNSSFTNVGYAICKDYGTYHDVVVQHFTKPQ